MSHGQSPQPAQVARLHPSVFSAGEAERLGALRARYERGEFREVTDRQRRAFARWLVENGWFAEAGPTRQRRDDRPLDEALAEVWEFVARLRGARSRPTGEDAAPR